MAVTASGGVLRRRAHRSVAGRSSCTRWCGRRSCGSAGSRWWRCIGGAAVRRASSIAGRELDELEAVRDALRPAVLVPRPALELAAHYVPAQQGVGGDFFLTAEGPRDSDRAAGRRRGGEGRPGRAAGGVRAHLARDVRALRGRSRRGCCGSPTRRSSTAPAPRRLRDGRVRGAPAGRSDAGVGDRRASAAAAARRRQPARLRGSGAAAGARDGARGRRRERAAARGRSACCSTRTGSSTRATARPSASGRSGCSRWWRRTGARARTNLVEHLRLALAEYAPVGGDDVCLLAARNLAPVGFGAGR